MRRRDNHRAVSDFCRRVGATSARSRRSLSAHRLLFLFGMKSLAAVMLVAACGTSSPDSTAIETLQAEQPVIDRVEFETATSIPANAPPNVTASATGDAARALYDATLALPVLSP